MNPQEKIQRTYMIAVRKLAEDTASYQLSYTPRGLQQTRGLGRASKRGPVFKATAHVQDDEIHVSWEQAPSDPEASQADFDQDVRARVQALHRWIVRLAALI